MASRKTKLMSGFVALLMLVSLFTGFVIPVSAETAGGGNVSGTGLLDATAYPDITAYTSSTTVYSVKDRAGMEKMAELVNNGTTLEGVTIYQIADIDMQHIPFEGIGYGDFTAPFNGTFDGNGFTIDNLFVYRGTTGNNKGYGLFGSAVNATFRNIGISGGLILGTNWVGSMVGRARSCKIINCWNAATVVGTSTQGTAGLAGTNIAGSITVNSYNVGLIYCNTSKASGIVGWINNTADKVANCYNAGEIVSGITNYIFSAEGHSISPVLCMALDQERGVSNANNYYIKGRGGPQMSSYELLLSGATTTIPGTATDFNGTHDAAIGLDASTLTDGALAKNLSAGFDADGAVDGYDICYEQVDGVGYPVLTYYKDGEIAIQRYAKDNTNVNGDKTWENASPLFASFAQNRDGAWLADGADRPTIWTISDPDDLFLLGALTFCQNLKTTFALEEINLGADIDFAEKTINPGIKFGVPLGTTVNFQIILDGKNHVIKNWSFYGIQFGYNPAGGLISAISDGAVVKNLGLLDAYGEYHAKLSGGYVYPALLVERGQGTNVGSIENCFATGRMVTNGITNSNNNGAVFSTTWNNSISMTDCWSHAFISENGGDFIGVRTIGKLLTGYDYSGVMSNIYSFQDEKPYLVTDMNLAYSVEQVIGADHTYGTGEAAYWLSNDGGMDQLYKAENGEIIFATEEDAARCLTINKNFPDETSVNSYKEYYSGGEYVTLKDIEGYALDLSSLPEGGTASGFTMPAADTAVTYTLGGADYTVAEDILAEYQQYDLNLFSNADAMQKIIDDASAIVALKSQEQTTDVINAALNQTSALINYEAGVTPVMKNVYPYYPTLSQKDLYEEFHDGLNWGISTKADWDEALSIGKTNGFAGTTLHFLNDVDMKNESIAPLCITNSIPFKGIVDGHGYVIKNLKVEYDVSSTNRWIGLIGFANGATVKNLGIESGSVTALGNVDGSTGNSEIMVSGFVGEGYNTKIYNCWNAATVDAGECYATVSGIARLTGTSVMDSCFNVGKVYGMPSRNTYSGGLSGYSQGTTGYWNSFSAAQEITGKITGTVRYNASGKDAYFGNTYSIGIAFDPQNTHTTEGQYELQYSDYASGKLAWLLNTNYVAGKGGQRAYYTNNATEGTVTFGNAENQTRQITLVSENDEYYYLYAAQGDTVELYFPATGDITYMLASGTGSSIDENNILTVGSGDVIIAVYYNGMYPGDLLDALDDLSGISHKYYTASNGQNLAEIYEEASTKAKHSIAGTEGGFADQAEVDDYLALLTGTMTFAEKYADIQDFHTLFSDVQVPAYMVDSLEDLEYLAQNNTLLGVEDIVLLGADIQVPTLSAANYMTELKASIDGQGHAISGLSVSTGWLGNYSGNFIKNLTISDSSVMTTNWNSGLLINQLQSTDLLIENVYITGCTMTKGNGANGFGALIGQIPSGKKATLKDITFINNTINRDCEKQGNNGGLIGPVVGVIVVDGMKIADNIYAGTTAKWGDAVLCGELVSAGNSIKNVLITRNKFTGSAPNGIISGVHKVSATVTFSNIVIADNETLDGIPVQGGIVSGSTAPTYTNVVTDTDGTVTTEAIAGGAKLYELNMSGVEKTWILTKEGIDFGTEGLPKKITFRATTENPHLEDFSAVRYTDADGILINLDTALLDAAEWNNEDMLATAVFKVDTTIYGTLPAAPYLAVGNATVKNGDVVRIPVSIRDNTGLAGIKFKVSYNSDVLTLNEVLQGDFSWIYVSTTPEISDGIASLNIAMADAFGSAENGVLAYLKFTVSSTAKSAAYAIETVPIEATDPDLNACTVLDGAGTVTVVCNLKYYSTNSDATPENAYHFSACECGENTNPVKCMLGGDSWHYSITEATCTDDGLVTASCDLCGYSYTEVLPALSHDEITYEAQAPTCTEKGWNAYVTCSRCDYTTYEEIPALGHDEITHEGQDATCTEKGWNAYVTCSRCDYTTYEEISALGHDEISHEGQAATCTKRGWKPYITCSRCDFTTYQVIPALGHDEITHEAQAATCTKKGWNAYVDCSRCDYTTYKEISALGHDEITHDAQAATCTEKGWNAYVTCSRCNHTTYEEITALGHDEISHEAQAATCTEKGWNAYVTCSRCDYTTYEEIAALGHTLIVAPELDATCTTAGNHEFFHCTSCQKEFKDADATIETTAETEAIPALGHSLEKVEAKLSTYTEAGNNEYYICTRCGQAFKDAEGTVKTTVEAETLPLKDLLKGDVNLDERVTIADAIAVLRVAAGQTDLPDQWNLDLANVCTEGDTEESKINTADAILIMQYIIGKVMEL
ncbi:MAG: hypothetical protein IJ043_00885 [Clostridia bacterium]|nr:hypothetical protein [Clostridia bacterium]